MHEPTGYAAYSIRTMRATAILRSVTKVRSISRYPNATMAPPFAGDIVATAEAFSQVMPLLRAMTEVRSGGQGGIFTAEGVRLRAPHTRWVTALPTVRPEMTAVEEAQPAMAGSDDAKVWPG